MWEKRPSNWLMAPILIVIPGASDCLMRWMCWAFGLSSVVCLNSPVPRQKGCYFEDVIHFWGNNALFASFKRQAFNENLCQTVVIRVLKFKFTTRDSTDIMLSNSCLLIVLTITSVIKGFKSIYFIISFLFFFNQKFNFYLIWNFLINFSIVW